jgi:CO dehydrogenase maturation factor
VDADINQHLAAALGHEGPPPRALGADPAWLKDHLRGDNPLIGSAAEMVKTTPPGRGSRLVDLDPSDELLARFAIDVDGVRHVVTGEFDEADIGVSCYHGKTGAVELWLNHLLDGPGEYVVVDMTAGADAFASGLFTRFDLTVLVSEPTRRGVGVHRQYAEHAAGHGVELRVLGNKVGDPSDVRYLREQVGDALVGLAGPVGVGAGGRARGVGPIEELEPANLAPSTPSGRCWTRSGATGRPTTAPRWSSTAATHWPGRTQHGPGPDAADRRVLRAGPDRPGDAPLAPPGCRKATFVRRACVKVAFLQRGPTGRSPTRRAGGRSPCGPPSPRRWPR